MRAVLARVCGLAMLVWAVGCSNKASTPNCIPRPDAGPDAGSSQIVDGGGSDAGALVDAGPAADAGPAVDAGPAIDAGSLPFCDELVSDGGRTLDVTFSFNGHDPFSGEGSFSRGDAGSCQALVGAFLQGGSVLTDAGPATVVLTLSSAYDGEGTYGVTTGHIYLLGDGAGDGGPSYANSLIGSDTSVLVNGDLSGSINFTQWGDAASDVENGTATWTCAP